MHCLSIAQPHTLRCPWRVLQAGLNCPVKLGIATILYNLVPQLLLTSFYVLGSIASCHGECHTPSSLPLQRHAQGSKHVLLSKQAEAGIVLSNCCSAPPG